MVSERSETSGSRNFLADNSLTIALFSLFVICLASQMAVGWRSYNESLAASHYPPIAFAPYLKTGTFLNAIFSNWQAAILQLGVLIAFSTVLRQRGAAHSRKCDDEDKEDGAPDDMRQNGAAETRQAASSGGDLNQLKSNFQFNPLEEHWLYRNSLSLTMFGLFIIFFALHATTSNMAYNEEQSLRHLSSESIGSYLFSSTFWYSCFQTWEAEFFAIGLYVVLSIFLRQERSPESKRVGASNQKTGDTNE